MILTDLEFGVATHNDQFGRGGSDPSQLILIYGCVPVVSVLDQFE